MKRLSGLFLAFIVGCSLGRAPDTAAPAEPTLITPAATALEDVVYVGAVPSANSDMSDMRPAAVEADGTLSEIAVAAADRAVALEAGAAFFALTRDGRTTVDRVDLRSGRASLKIDVGPALAPSAAQRAPFAVSSDGKTVLIGRFLGDMATLHLELFDGSSGERIASTVLRAPPGSTVSGIASAPRHDRIIVRLWYWKDRRVQTIEWLGLDRDLRVLERASGEAVPTRLSWPLACWQELQPLPGTRTFVTHCGDAVTRWLQFVDAETLAPVGQTDLPSVMTNGQTIGWNVGADGRVIVLTERPALVRVDGASRKLLDTREVATEKSFRLDLFAPQVALAKIYVSPNLQWSPDGRTVYVAPIAADIPHAWRRGLVVIDVGSAAIVRRAPEDQDVRGIHLSANGARLYVLTSERKDAVAAEGGRLLTLDARSGEVRSRTNVLAKPAFGILAVVPRP